MQSALLNPGVAWRCVRGLFKGNLKSKRKTPALSMCIVEYVLACFKPNDHAREAMPADFSF